MANNPHPNPQLIEQFYTSFARRDFTGMCACYSPDIEFTDPVFTTPARQTRLRHVAHAL